MQCYRTKEIIRVAYDSWRLANVKPWTNALYLNPTKNTKTIKFNSYSPKTSTGNKIWSLCHSFSANTAEQ